MGFRKQTTVFGPFSGKLSNGGDSVELEQPDVPQGIGHINMGYVPYVTVEYVKYSDAYPWPATADGTGYSLQRINPLTYGNEPTNWLAQLPTPGRGNFDRDADGIPDSWETAHGLDPNNAADAKLDPDGDGMDQPSRVFGRHRSKRRCKCLKNHERCN